MIVAFDLGLHLGWSALDNAAARVNSGRENLPAKHGKRWHRMSEIVATLLGNYRPVGIAYERPVGGGPQRNNRATFIVHGGLLAIIELEAHRCGIAEPVALSPTEWKRVAVGHGHAGKTDYVAAANERFGLHLDIKGEDEAAALLIGYAAIKLGKVGG